MIYGLYNRNYQYKLSVKENQKSLDMYDGYLKRMYEKEGLLKHDFEKKVNLYIKKYVILLNMKRRILFMWGAQN